MAQFEFNPERVAYFEGAGWRAYYDHAWFKLMRLVIGMCEEQFRIPAPQSWLASYYIARASAAWVAVDHDEAKVLALLEKFYNIALRYSGLSFDPVEAGRLEIRYWEVHRRLSGKADKTEFIQVMTDLHSLVFGIPPELARESAEYRVMANNTVDTITSHTSADPEADWHKLEEELRLCYRSIHRALYAEAVKA